METIEIFKDVPNYDGNYQVSNLGRAKSFKCNNEIILKSSINKNGYCVLSLRRNGVKISEYIHQLVAIAFLNHVPCGRQIVVNHINFIKTDNRVENLEIITQRENANKKHIKSSSEYTGVSWHKLHKKWTSTISINNKKKHLGCFINELDASKAYKNALLVIIKN